jgi:hypothetical protein
MIPAVQPHPARAITAVEAQGLLHLISTASHSHLETDHSAAQDSKTHHNPLPTRDHISAEARISPETLYLKKWYTPHKRNRNIGSSYLTTAGRILLHLPARMKGLINAGPRASTGRPPNSLEHKNSLSTQEKSKGSMYTCTSTFPTHNQKQKQKHQLLPLCVLYYTCTIRSQSKHTHPHKGARGKSRLHSISKSPHSFTSLLTKAKSPAHSQ